MENPAFVIRGIPKLVPVAVMGTNGVSVTMVRTNGGDWRKIPFQPAARLMMGSPELHGAFDEGPGKRQLMGGYFALRPQVFPELYVQTNLWAAYVKTLPPGKD